ncbi:hypothetical protein [Maridesulfovibrio bastinii]|uniref:hypothetical protein n=1 Tax=Maridesulfovibrio bastinii TaxID=47157 RepID=UPI00040835CD|nr:hypothetical protein [Maridesulfovibrio bastinii]
MFGIGGPELKALFALLLYFIPAIWSSKVAKAKGRSGFVWFFIGLLFCPLGVIAVYLVPAKAGGDYIDCPYCAETIKKQAIVCKHCHRNLVDASQD